MVIFEGNTPVIVGRRDILPRKAHRKKRSECGVERATPMQKRALENHLLRGMNKTQAMKEAGYSQGSQVSLLNNAMQKRPIVEALERRQITNDLVAQVIGGGLEATRPDYKDFPDHSVRLSAAREVNRIVGNYAPTKIQAESRSIVVHISSADAERLNQYRRMRGANGTGEDRRD